MSHPRRHLFIQLGTYGLAELAQHLNTLYEAGDDRVDLIVTFTGRRGEGDLYLEHLDVLDNYLPWGQRPLAGNVFFGTQVDYTGWSGPYSHAMKNPDFRWTQLLLQRRILFRLAQRYAGRPWHFYIEHEGVLDIIAQDPLVASAYEAYLIQSIRDFRYTIGRGGGAVAWSPAFWNYSVPSGAAQVLNRLFERVKAYAGEPGLDWILLQDVNGRGWDPDPTPAQVHAWYLALGTSFRSKQVNVEQFDTVNGQLVPGDPGRIAMLEDAYGQRGMRVGASWEMRWYMRQPELVQQPSLADVASIGTGGTWPYPAAHNTWASRRQQVRDWLRDGRHRGSYSRRAELAAYVGEQIAALTGLEVQGIRYMRPYDPSPSSGRAVNSDHLTAGAIDIMIRDPADRVWLAALYALLDELERRHVVRYIIRLGQNAAHWNHIHVSFQIGAQL